MQHGCTNQEQRNSLMQALTRLTLPMIESDEKLREKEQAEDTVSFRQRGGGEQGTMKYEDFAKKIIEEVRKMTEKC